MKISLNWIKNYVPELKYDSALDLKKKMIKIGLDIESFESESEKFENFVVAEVVHKDKHPDADKLTVCRINTGSEELTVICGAPNVEKGQKVCFAKIGAVIPQNGMEIKKTKIRGVTSYGMICAEDELGLSNDHSGIMILDSNAKVGMNFSDYIGANDILIEIGVTPNRGDLLSHFGMAREIAAATGFEFVKPDIDIKESQEKSSDLIGISIENKKYCKRFTGRVVKNIKINESPVWLKKYLASVGLRPRNNIVDITNFVMMETGQPLHAFDYDKIGGKKIIVKLADKGDKFITLDSKERVLNEYSLMVCDSNGPSAIAGVMGGEFSEITDDTKNVFIESAYFDPVCIRKNSKLLGLLTDASQRFERGVDIENVIYASNRAAQLMQKLADGEVCTGIVDAYPERFEKLFVDLRPEKVNEILGKNIPENVIIELLESIGIKLTEKGDKKLCFEIPEFRRNDLQREIDLIEETARLYGYDNFENQYSFNLDLNANVDYKDGYLIFKDHIKNYFIGKGFNEIISYSQQDETVISDISSHYVSIENPNSVEMNVMRVNLLQGIISAMKLNYNRSGKDVSLKLFEMGKVFRSSEDGFSESENLCFAVSAKSDYTGFDVKEREFDVFDFKGEIEQFLTKFNLENFVLFYYNANENKFSDVIVNGDTVGSFYFIDYDGYADKRQNIFAAEFNLEVLYNKYEPDVKYKEINKYPPVKRDLSLVSGESLKYEQIDKSIRKNAGKSLKSIKIFDIYKDKKLGEDKKSIALSLEFNSNDKTLTDEEVNKSIDNIVKGLDKELNIKLR
ncbi:MAG: phenylalanine--tRNA ligase subunit beta [Ignavibacteria bacterium]|nr:phenylalanine--tRNA ligase subunit beta [Ignavibacteria bacterium]